MKEETKDVLKHIAEYDEADDKHGYVLFFVRKGQLTTLVRGHPFAIVSNILMFAKGFKEQSQSIVKDCAETAGIPEVKLREFVRTWKGGKYDNRETKS